MLWRMGDRRSYEAPRILAYRLNALMQEQNVPDLDHGRIHSGISLLSRVSQLHETVFHSHTRRRANSSFNFSSSSQRPNGPAYPLAAASAITRPWPSNNVSGSMLAIGSLNAASGLMIFQPFFRSLLTRSPRYSAARSFSCINST